MKYPVTFKLYVPGFEVSVVKIFIVLEEAVKEIRVESKAVSSLRVSSYATGQTVMQDVQADVNAGKT
jgi:hypothetical protein